MIRVQLTPNSQNTKQDSSSDDAFITPPTFHVPFLYTGAGKSTLMVALLRICELDSGSIKIDGVEISNPWV